MDTIKRIFLRDNFFFGALLGFVLPAVAFILIQYISAKTINSNHEMIVKPFGVDRMQVYAIVINLLPFRFYMVNRELDRTGKGIIFATIVLVIAYFIMYFRYHGTLGY
jgi:hypothetical protein